MFYITKLQWLQPKEGTDEMEKKRKSFLVNALSCSEAEMKILKWCPANYQDPVVKGTTESTIIDLKNEFDSEIYWEAKLADENEKGKLVPFNVAIDGGNHIEVIKKLDSLYGTSEFLSIKKMSCIVDDDLIQDTLNNKPLIPNEEKEEE